MESASTEIVKANPAQLYKQATDVAGACKEIVLRTACNIQGKKYVKVEGWESIAIAHGCFAGADEAERAYDNQGNHIGYKAKGYIRRDGQIISTGEGFVGFDETDRKGNATWRDRPEYAGRAMAQTRAISRACRSAFAHVVVLMDANLETTPFEEVPQEGFREHIETRPEPVQPSENRFADGKWREVVIHFGKLKGVKLGKLDEKSLGWWVSEWQPKPYRGTISGENSDLRLALDEARKELGAARDESLQAETLDTGEQNPPATEQHEAPKTLEPVENWKTEIVSQGEHKGKKLGELSFEQITNLFGGFKMPTGGYTVEDLRCKKALKLWATEQGK